MEATKCYHCGDYCNGLTISYQNKSFCCNGCKTVFELFFDNGLTSYYDFQSNPGTVPKEIGIKYDYLEEEKIQKKLLDFSEGDTYVLTLYIPQIHCSSCIWILENLQKLAPAIISSQVNFPKKTVRVTYNSKNYNLKKLVILLASIAYEPYISLNDYSGKKQKANRHLIYKLGIAGFAFGNIMFLSFPEYFEISEYWLDKYKHVFRGLMFIFSLPVVFYASQDYFISAYKGLKSRYLNIDIPIALGISVLFIRSSIEILLDLGAGFFDSLSGLIFFLLLGKFFQQKTYNYLSFDRDYKSYFPIAVTRISKDNEEENVPISTLKKEDKIIIRNQELIPTDSILLSGEAQIDYSFVTGESVPVFKKAGDTIFAGGKQLAGIIQLEVSESVSQSYLTQLWSNDAFKKKEDSSFKSITDSISKNFTIGVLSIAFLASLYWTFIDSSKVLNVFTAVLIIACPCAIALAAPFAFGNTLRIFGKRKFYLKNIEVIEKLSKITTVIFDKTGTLTSTKINDISYEGEPLTKAEKTLFKSALRASNHPLSRELYAYIKTKKLTELTFYKEDIGKGITAKSNSKSITFGTADYVGYDDKNKDLNTCVYLKLENEFKGKFIFKNSYRLGLKNLFKTLRRFYKIAIVSGDNEGEKEMLQKLFSNDIQLDFNQKPHDKLEVIKKLQEKQQKVIMVGDGLNDAGALMQSDVGIAISENTNVFTPACDAILDASKLTQISGFMSFSKKTITVIRYAFLLSLCYNIVGLFFAVTGQLKPVIAAILMPLSSITIVAFVTLTTNLLAKKILKNEY